MGSHKIQQIDLSQTDDQTDKKSRQKPAKKTPATPLVDPLAESDSPAEETSQTTAKPTQKKVRSKRYQTVRGQVDRTKVYPLHDAVSLVKKLHYARFDTAVTADITAKETGIRLEVAFPHSTGRTTKVAIATDALLKKVEAGEIDFDVLLATKDMMGKIAKHAKVLGPKGLMPNPKNGTITDDPAKKKKELEGGKTLITTEKKAPLMHVIIGTTDQKEALLADNLESLIKAIGAGRITKLVISSTMSPGIKIDLSTYQAA